MRRWPTKLIILESQKGSHLATSKNVGFWSVLESGAARAPPLGKPPSFASQHSMRLQRGKRAFRHLQVRVRPPLENPPSIASQQFDRLQRGKRAFRHPQTFGSRTSSQSFQL